MTRNEELRIEQCLIMMARNFMGEVMEKETMNDVKKELLSLVYFSIKEREERESDAN